MDLKAMARYSQECVWYRQHKNTVSGGGRRRLGERRKERGEHLEERSKLERVHVSLQEGGYLLQLNDRQLLVDAPSECL